MGEVGGGELVSRHLDILRRAGLVRSRREERHVYCAIDPETVAALVRLLTACC